MLKVYWTVFSRTNRAVACWEGMTFNLERYHKIGEPRGVSPRVEESAGLRDSTELAEVLPLAGRSRQKEKP